MDPARVAWRPVPVQSNVRAVLSLLAGQAGRPHGGGNVARSPDRSSFDTPYAFQRLTTKRPLPDPRLFTVTCATSAATTQAAHLAASILAEYPNLWPETVRGLIVHSAEWAPVMRARFDGAQGRQPGVALQRRYGMGVPDLLRATRSATDALTLVVEDVIHPFHGEGRMREMHLHDLPWPGEVLAHLGEASVRLRVTLSCFIEPNPGRRGWVRRYRYSSHGLRFDVRRPTESNDDFRKRINQLALAEEERRPAAPKVTPQSGTLARLIASLDHFTPTSGAAPLLTLLIAAKSRSIRLPDGGKSDQNMITGLGRPS